MVAADFCDATMAAPVKMRRSGGGDGESERSETAHANPPEREVYLKVTPMPKW